MVRNLMLVELEIGWCLDLSEWLWREKKVGRTCRLIIESSIECECVLMCFFSSTGRNAVGQGDDTTRHEGACDDADIATLRSLEVKGKKRVFKRCDERH